MQSKSVPLSNHNRLELLWRNSFCLGTSRWDEGKNERKRRSNLACLATACLIFACSACVNSAFSFSKVNWSMKTKVLLSEVFDKECNWGLPSTFFWWIIVEQTWSNRLAKLRVIRKWVKTIDITSINCFKLRIDFAGIWSQDDHSIKLYNNVWDEWKNSFLNQFIFLHPGKKEKEKEKKKARSRSQQVKLHRSFDVDCKWPHIHKRILRWISKPIRQI